MPLYSPLSPDVQGFRHVGTIGATAGPTASRWTIAGTLAATALTGNATMVVGQSYAYPLYVGTAGVIEAAGVRVATGTGGNVHVALYSNTSATVLYPNARLQATADVSTATSSAFATATGLSWAVSADTLYWVVVQASAAVPVMAVASTAQWPILGYTNDATNYPYGGTCWLGAGTYATFPTTFQTDAVPGTLSNYPAAWLRFSS